MANFYRAAIECVTPCDDTTADIAARIRNALQVIKLRQACGITYTSQMSDDDARASLSSMSLEGAEVLS